jgi:hypothetical protein
MARPDPSRRRRGDAASSLSWTVSKTALRESPFLMREEMHSSYWKGTKPMTPRRFTISELEAQVTPGLRPCWWNSKPLPGPVTGRGYRRHSCCSSSGRLR